MSKTRETAGADETRAESDFSAGVRGKHADAFAAGTNVVRLDVDVAEAFPDATAVNQALRALIAVARRSVPRGDRGARRKVARG